MDILKTSISIIAMRMTHPAKVGLWGKNILHNLLKKVKIPLQISLSNKCFYWNESHVNILSPNPTETI